MKKEMFIAVFIGLTFGLIITYGIYLMRAALTKNSEVVTVVASPSPSPTTNATVLTVINPENGIIQTEKEVTVSGTTIPKAYVVLFVNNTDYISNADDEGNFSFNAILELGSNVLTIHTVNENGTTTSTERTVIVQNDTGAVQTSTDSASQDE